MRSVSGHEREARKWVSAIKAEGRMRWSLPLMHCLLLLVIMTDRASAISYRKDTGFATDGADQFVFREPSISARDPPSGEHFTPMYTYNNDPQVKRSGRVRFGDDSGTASFNGGVKKNFFGTGSVVSEGSSPGGSPFFQRDRDSDQFYTVGASIQFAGSGGDTITPPPPVVPANNQQKPKRRKNKYKYGANDKIYNAADGSELGQFSPYATYGEPQRYAGPLQGNYLTPNGARPQQGGGQYDPTMLNYPELQKQQYPFSIGAQFPGNTNYYYNTQQQGVAGPGPYNPYQYQYPGTYAAEAPYTNPYRQGFYSPAQQLPSSTGLGQPPNAQSILGVLQSIFNFAPGTFGSLAAPTRPGSAFSNPQGPGASFGGVGGQLRQALDNISENDELQCVPKLVCMMSRSSTGQGFSSYVNRGLLSTILSAVPDSSPWLKFSRAALLGYGIGANSCDAYYPKCPKDEMEILYYLNNHRGGFFRFFSNGEQGQQQQQQQQYG